MSTPEYFTWRPNWKESEILATKSSIAERLQAGRWKSSIDNRIERSRGSTWLSRQFDIMSRSAYSQLDTIQNKIQRIANDAPRVLRLINTQWDTYMARVRMQRDNMQRDRICKLTKEGPANLYLFLVTEHINKAWYTQSTGMESSALSCWNKIGYDNQFLWSFSQYKSTFLGM